MRSHYKLLVAACVASGCYAPAAAPGGYTCSAGGACPANLTCRCGTCVRGADDEACRIEVAIDTASCAGRVGDNCLTEEGREFKVNLRAFTGDGRTSRYAGTATIGSSWGHARAVPFTFSEGVASAMVTVDRATPANTTAVLRATAGDAVGVSTTSIVVDPAPLRPEPGPVLTTKSGWAQVAMGHPAVDRTARGVSIYFSGIASIADGHSKIGLATQRADGTWAVTGPVFAAAGDAHYFSPSVLRLGDADLRVFFSYMPGAKDSFADVHVARSGDDGRNFTMPERTLTPSVCPWCNKAPGIYYPWVLRDPDAPGGWLLYVNHSSQDGGPVSSVLSRARTLDEGKSWHFDPVPAPGTGVAVSASLPQSTRVLWDPSTRMYRMWYAQQIDLLNGCKTVIQYATSEDGLFWTSTRKPYALAVEEVAWAPLHNAQPPVPQFPIVGLLPGAVEVDPASTEARYTVWFSPVAAVVGYCAPMSIGRATRK